MGPPPQERENERTELTQKHGRTSRLRSFIFLFQGYCFLYHLLFLLFLSPNVSRPVFYVFKGKKKTSLTSVVTEVKKDQLCLPRTKVQSGVKLDAAKEENYGGTASSFLNVSRKLENNVFIRMFSRAVSMIAK